MARSGSRCRVRQPGDRVSFCSAMENMKRFRVGLLLLAALLVGAPVRAEIDLSGNWVSREHEDWQDRTPGPEIVDYSGLPLNADGRARALSYSTSALSQPERQ